MENIGCVVIVRNMQNQYLLVKETRNRGYSAPGGKLE